MTFIEFLNERFLNLIDDKESKRELAQEVWDILVFSYKPVGGLKGSGFKNKEDMIENIPFWKIMKSNKKIVGVLMYKDKGGRKRVALGTDGSNEGKAMLSDALKNDFNRSYGEVSDNSWRFIQKHLTQEYLLSVVKLPSEVQKILKKDIFELDEVPKSKWVSKIKPDKTDPFYDYYYLRNISGELHVKIMLGIDGLEIK